MFITLWYSYILNKIILLFILQPANCCMCYRFLYVLLRKSITMCIFYYSFLIHNFVNVNHCKSYFAKEKRNWLKAISRSFTYRYKIRETRSALIQYSHFPLYLQIQNLIETGLFFKNLVRSIGSRTSIFPRYSEKNEDAVDSRHKSYISI